MSPITTHVLDTALGRPAAGVPVCLELQDGSAQWRELGRGRTDADGRCRALLPDGHVLASGVYRITFETGSYFSTLGVQGFYPSVPVVFEIREPAQHYHVPLLVSPFGYSTYRGS
jgi:5-hydroxyisourate hydrolase